MTFLAAVAVFSFATAGFVGSLAAFLVFAATMGALVFLLARLGARARAWSRRVQPATDLLVLVAGAGLVVDGAGHFLDRLLLGA